MDKSLGKSVILGFLMSLMITGMLFNAVEFQAQPATAPTTEVTGVAPNNEVIEAGLFKKLWCAVKRGYYCGKCWLNNDPESCTRCADSCGNNPVAEPKS